MEREEQVKALGREVIVAVFGGGKFILKSQDCNEDSKRHLQCHALPLVMEGVSFAELTISYSFYMLQKQVRQC